MDATLTNSDVRMHIEHLGELDCDARLKLLLQWLRWDDGARNAAALLVCRRTGAPAVDLLIFEALARGKRTEYRLEILDVIERIGLPFNASQFLRLLSAKLYMNPVVTSRIHQLVGRLKGADGSAAAAAEQGKAAS